MRYFYVERYMHLSRMYFVASSKTYPQHLQRLRQWCLAEWSSIDDFGNGIDIPLPVVAILEQKLIGGLAFTSYPAPGSNSSGLWINAVIVDPEYRGKGVASRLIVAAEAEARRIGAAELFVYSGVAGLYRKAGWIELSNDGGNIIFRKVLSS